jgi:oxygen-independent coproporphyrinogen-3 oxidase
MVGSVEPSMSEVADYINQTHAHAPRPVTGFVLGNSRLAHAKITRSVHDNMASVIR